MDPKELLARIKILATSRSLPPALALDLIQEVCAKHRGPRPKKWPQEPLRRIGLSSV
jgi:hypothetical protein